jgi:NTE family protein
MQVSVDKPARKTKAPREVQTKSLNLALQGGGSHGAFTWGVLDRLLEEDKLDFEGVVATSAGAMNACVMAYGMAEGGREGARKALTHFWRRISHAMVFSPLQPTAIDKLTGNRALENSPPYIVFDLMTRLLSPYQFNPFDFNPLRRVLEQSVDFDALKGSRCNIKLHICATNVRTGKIKVFENDEITPDAILASACLPFLFRAVEIDGEAYWDGGYMGNPAIFPLIYNCASPDVLIVHINPMYRQELPKSATEIMNRVNEISFNSSLMREMRAIAFVTKIIDGGMADHLNLKRMFIHSISAEDVTGSLSVASKLNGDWGFLTDMRDAGRHHAEKWLAANFDRIGKESSVDIHSTYL